MWCYRCDIGFTFPGPVVDYSMYTSEPRNLEQWLRYADETVEFVLTSVGKVASWFDFGAGGGELLIAVSRRGIRHTLGVDFDVRGRALATARGIRVHRSLEDLDGETFDVVSASHVLEHVADPIETVQRLIQHLQPEGVFVVSQPNPRGLLPRLAPSRWAGWVVTEHYWHFTVKSMTTLLQRCGLSVLSSRNSSLDHRLHFNRALPFDAIGQAGKAIGIGDQFLLLARRE